MVLSMDVLRVTSFVLLLAVPAGYARADQYLPLSIGNWWEYRGAYLGEHEVQRVERAVTVGEKRLALDVQMRR